MSYLSELNQAIENQEALEQAEENLATPGRMVVQTKAVLTGSPKFTAQFDLKVLTQIPSGFNGGTPLQFPVVIFGNSDWFGQFADAIKQYQMPGVIYLGAFIFPQRALASNVIANNGDLILQWTDSSLRIASVIIRCTNVAYGSLLAAISSDRFTTNLFRMSTPSLTNILQFSNEIQVAKLSLFGKTVRDTISPLSYKNPNQQQPNIIDVNASLGIDKQTVLSTVTEPVAFTTGLPVEMFSMSVFVEREQKLLASAGSQMAVPSRRRFR